MSDEVADWVVLEPRSTPGWPWPEDSYGLTPMFGTDGWCRGCGTPLVEQSGALVIQGKQFPTASVWTPNWLFDVVRVVAPIADEISARFRVDLGDVYKPRQEVTGVKQLLPVRTTAAWYAPEDLAQAVLARHGEHNGTQPGTSCADCHAWRWLPLAGSDAPIQRSALNSDSDVIASPETFGDGTDTFRQLLFRRDLGALLVEASPRNWNLVEITTAT